MLKFLIIDGYNVINKIPVLDEKTSISLEFARNFFISILRKFCLDKTFNKIIVVFDSKADNFYTQKQSYGKLEVIYSFAGRDADNVIVDILRKFFKKAVISVVSDDNFVKNHSKAYSASIITVKEFEKMILPPKKVNKVKSEKKLDDNVAQDIEKELKKYYNL